MKTYLTKSLLLLAAAATLASCDADISGSLDEDGSAGRGNFSTFVAVGDSLTAGYADGALYRQIQENSLPYIMAQQFMLAGGGAFTQPLMPMDATGSLLFGGTDLGRIDRQVLVETGDPDSPAAPSDITPTVSSDIATESIPGLYNNVGVPGAKSFHLGVAGYGDAAGLVAVPPTANPYFVRFANDPVNSSMLVDALAQAPSFFTLWIGANDVLLYALDGGATQNAVPPYGLDTTDVTDPAVFTPSFDGAVAALTAVPGTQGLLINVPDVATIPFFTTVPYDAIPLDAATAAVLNEQFAVYNAGVTSLIGIPPANLTAEEAASRQIVFVAGQNAVLILDESLTDLTVFDPGLINMRQATADDYILLTASTKLGVEAIPGDPATAWGVTNPLLDADVLIEFEYDQVEVARAAYNDTIEAAAAANPDLLFFDADALLVELNENGISYGSGGITSEFATGGGFSLDGVHPTARGYAVIANEIFKVIGAGFDAYIPPVNPSDYTTVHYQ